VAGCGTTKHSPRFETLPVTAVEWKLGKDRSETNEEEVLSLFALAGHREGYL
jgi:hypothetical protein